MAKGEYVQFLDADDLLSKDKIELQVRALVNQPNAIAVCNTMHFYSSFEDGVITDKEFLYSTHNTEEFLLNLYGVNGKQNMVQTSACLTPKVLLDQIGPWDETLSNDQNGEYFCRVVSMSDQVIYVPNIVNYYRKHIKGTNIANQKQHKHLESQLRALDSKAKFIELKDSSAYKNAMALQYKIIAIDAYPEHKTIYETTTNMVNQIGCSRCEPVLRGKIIERINYIFSWRIAKTLPLPFLSTMQEVT